MAKHQFGNRVVNYLDGTIAAYALNFIAIAYSVALFLAGVTYFFLNVGKLVWTSPAAWLSSVINLHTGSSIFALSSAGALTGNHVIIVAVIGTMALLAPRIINGRFLGWENLRSLRHGYFYAALYPAFALAIHELLWYATYVGVGYPNEVAILSSPMFDFGLAIIIVNFFLRGITRYDLALAASMSIYYLAWMQSGFHITVDFLGKTVFFSNLMTNFIEDGSWLWLLTFFVMIYTIRRKILGSMPKV